MKDFVMAVKDMQKYFSRRDTATKLLDGNKLFEDF